MRKVLKLMFGFDLANLLYLTGGLIGLATVFYSVIKKELYLNADTVLFSAFLLLSWISAVVGYGISLSFFSSKFICAWMMILAVYYAMQTASDPKRLFGFAALVISAVELFRCLSVLYHATNTLFNGTTPASLFTGCFRYGRLCALWNANTFGFMCTSLIFVSVLGIAISKGILKAYYGFAAFVGWFCLGLTGSRTGAVAVGTGLGIILFSEALRNFCYGRKDHVILRYISSAAASVLAVALVTESFLLPGIIYRYVLELFTNGTILELRTRRIRDDDGTLSSRTYIWDAVIRTFFKDARHFLLGVSPLSRDMVGGAYNGHHEMVEYHSHNTFIELTRIHGFSGLLIWVVLLVRWGKSAAKSIFDPEGTKPARYMAACAAGILLMGLSEPVPLIYSSSMYLTIPFFIICGMFEKLRREKK